MRIKATTSCSLRWNHPQDWAGTVDDPDIVKTSFTSHQATKCELRMERTMVGTPLQRCARIIQIGAFSCDENRRE
jgi:hypothetical protein